MGALAINLTSLQTTLKLEAFLFDDEGKEILSQPTPAEADALAQRVWKPAIQNSWSRTELNMWPGERLDQQERVMFL